MTKKDIKGAAAAGTSVFDQIANGLTQDIQDIQNTQDASDAQDIQNTQRARSGRPAKYDEEMERINLKIPARLKEYLTIAAAHASIEQRRQISFTEYLCNLVEEDRKRREEQ